jgi:DNA-binding transcriptional LysR family regulator
LDTKRLIHFKTLSETGNLRAAAKLLGLSHPGLAKSLRILEDEVGAALVTKDGRGIRLTPMGRSLLKEMETLLTAERRLLGIAREGKIREAHQVRIGAFDQFSNYLAPELVRAFPDGTKVTFDDLLPGQIEQAVANDQADFGITFFPVTNSKVDHFEIGKVPMAVFANIDFLPRYKILEQAYFVVPLQRIESTTAKAKILDGWPDNLPRKIRFSVIQMEPAMALAREGFAAIYLPRFVVERHNEWVAERFRLSEVQVEGLEEASLSIYAIKHKDAAETKLFKSICRVLRKIC